MNEDNFILEDVDRELTLNEKIEKITSEFEPKVVEYNESDGGWSVKIQDQKSGMEFWVDVWVDTNYNDVETEWNQYIFDVQDDDDQLRSAIQNDNNVWDLASSEAISYLEENKEIKQNEKGEWEAVYKTPDGEFYEIYEEYFNDETGDIDGAGRIWNVETGMEREFVFTFDVQGSAIYFNDFSTGDELDIRNENLINEIKSFADDHKDEIEHYITFTIDESKKVEEAVEDKTNSYNGYTFIPMGNVKSNINSFNVVKINNKLNDEFNKDNGTYDYNEFYKVMPPVDVFKIKELDDILVMPGSNYLFEYNGDIDTIIPMKDIQDEEELRKPDEQGLIGTPEDKEVVADMLDDEKDYMDISSKYGYSFNDYQLYNIATIYKTSFTNNAVKQKIEDVLENINYHYECAEIMKDAQKFKDSLFINKKTEDVAINNGFNVTKYPEVQSLADDIANSLKDKKKVTLVDVIEAIENWDGGDTSVFTIIERVDKDLYAKLDDHNTENEDNRYEAENQFLGLVEDTLNDMGITVYDEYDESKKTEDVAKNTYGNTNADEINKTIKDKEFMKALGITAEDVIKQVEISKKEFDELVNYVENYRGTFGELYKELQGWNLGYDDVEKDDDNLFDCYYKSLLVTINVDDGKLSVSPHDVYIYPNDITKVDSDELFHLDFDKPIEFDKILKEDATQCGAVDGGRVSIFGEKEKIEEDNEYFSYVTSRDVKETLDDLLSGNYDIMFDYNVENFVDDLIKYLRDTNDSEAGVIAWDLNQACISAERSNRRAGGTKPRKLIQALKSAKVYLDGKEKKTESFVFESKLIEDVDVQYNTDELLDKIMNNVPNDVKYLDDYAFEYKGLYIELRPDTIFTDNTPPEMDFAVFETEEDMNTDYELNIGTGYVSMVPYYRYWEAVTLYCDKLLEK